MSKGWMTILVILPLIFLGCTFRDNNKQRYNELSRQHNQLSDQAVIKQGEAEDEYNQGNYAEAQGAAEAAKKLFEEARAVSEQSLEQAKKIKEYDWLVAYQEKVSRADGCWVDIMSKIVAAATAELRGDTKTANRSISSIQDQEEIYKNLQEELQKIKTEHPDFFKGE